MGLSKKEKEQAQLRAKENLQNKLTNGKDFFQAYDWDIVAKNILYACQARQLRDMISGPTDIVIVAISTVDRMLERVDMSIRDLSFFLRRSLQEGLIGIITEFLPRNKQLGEMIEAVDVNTWRSMLTTAIIDYEQFVD